MAKAEGKDHKRIRGDRPPRLFRASIKKERAQDMKKGSVPSVFLVKIRGSNPICRKKSTGLPIFSGEKAINWVGRPVKTATSWVKKPTNYVALNTSDVAFPTNQVGLLKSNSL